MGTERKCSSCGEWNMQDVCSVCGQDLNPKRERIRKIREVQKKKEEEEPSRLETFLLIWKETKNPILKIFYWMGYSVWVVYMAILSMIAFCIAWGPG